MRKILGVETNYRYAIMIGNEEFCTFAIQVKDINLANTVAKNVVLHSGQAISNYQVIFVEEFQSRIVESDPGDGLMKAVENYNLYLGEDEEPMTLERLKQIIAEDEQE